MHDVVTMFRLEFHRGSSKTKIHPGCGGNIVATFGTTPKGGAEPIAPGVTKFA